MSHARIAFVSRIAVVGVMAAVLLGCTRGSGGGSATSTPPNEVVEVLLLPFDAPPLEELEADVIWVDMPVRDSLAYLREHLAESPPDLTAAEALKLRNNNDADNARIRSALGQLPDSPAAVDYGATITRHLRGDVSSTNPVLQNSVEEVDVLTLTGGGLFTFDWNMEPFADGDYVLSWQTSEDNLYDKVVVRNDLTWSDGAPFTAHDVVFSFQTILDSRIVIPAVRTGTDEIRWVEAYDDQTLIFFHKESKPTNVWNLNFPLIPQHIYRDSIDDDTTLTSSRYHVDYENNPVCLGPYIIESRTRGSELLLRRRESWYRHQGREVRTKPYFETIRFRIMLDSDTALLALNHGDLDTFELNPEQWTGQTNDSSFYDRNTKVRAPEWTYFCFQWNCETIYFKDRRVREAMSYAFDYDEMFQQTLNGLMEPCLGIFHPSAWMAPPTPQPYHQDLERAEQLLEEAGWLDHDGDGVLDLEVDGSYLPFEFTILTRDIPVRKNICLLLKESLARIGVVCNVRPLEPTVLTENLMKHKFHAAFGGWGTGTDPYTYKNIFGTGEERNWCGYSDPEVDRLLAAGEREFDREQRAKDYAQMAEIIWRDQPYTFLYYQSSFWGFNRELRGYNFSPRGPFHYGPGFSSVWHAAH